MDTRKNTKLLYVAGALLVSAVCLVGYLAPARASHATDLRDYYPNRDVYEDDYLEGFNYVTGTAQRAVLWFEKMDSYTFRQYNSAPESAEADCHWDQMSWWNDNTLRYIRTHHECSGVTDYETVYDDTIIFMPRYWDPATTWSYSGSTSASHYEGGVLVCTGTNNYTSEILGEVEIAPGEFAIHHRITQTTDWDWDHGTPTQNGCAAGYTTNWQEEYWLGDLPDGYGSSSTEKGIRRSKGGNLDAPSDTWDIWFDHWDPLP